ncbi:50S ribosomal protein L23 [Streptobacillus felis]|uniref:Large ribosomal subunit protein uL23 n=1 Tax=Streptobacillus felis TaxID=1384509 RepID=A0A7Z0T8W0_9FUSO|nr:50S ribosomal protein L23 [Streptobacillus felis]NYV28339.1 50S ribosomal protein L23 [Streptobacillus felis]
MTIFDVIKKPVLNTEKARILLNSNEYVFIVDRRANKLQIKEAVEKLFNVKVANVNTINMKPTTARARMTVYKTPAYKKAIVKLVDGDSIKAYDI